MAPQFSSWDEYLTFRITGSVSVKISERIQMLFNLHAILTLGS